MRTGKPAMPVVAKLSDFGLSMRLPAGQDHLKDVHHGTPYYQCPVVMERGTCSLAADVYSLGVLLWELYHGPPPWRGRRRAPAAKAKQQQQPPTTPREYLITNRPSRDGTAAGEAAEEPPQKLGLGSDGVWHDPEYSLRACDVLQFAPHCPNRYARLVRRCLAADPRDRPSARSVVKELLRMERGIAAAAATTAATATATATTTAVAPVAAAPAVAAPAGLADPPAGAVMALARPQRNHSSVGYGDGAANAAGGSDVIDDAALLLEDYDAAAAAVAAALARVTARPAAEGAPATTRAVAPPPRDGGQVAAAGEGGGSGSPGPVVPDLKASTIQPADTVAAASLADAPSPKRKACNRASGPETKAGAASPLGREAGDGAPATSAAFAAAAASGASAGATAARSPAATRPAVHATTRKPPIDVMTLE
ncbi:hypothetical protein GPECTOR_123g477 [Gonium pectorale]|uniref:Protein kinase domain-containing protein n=1 Tax=Gonium pectorale TaxID=33097 RepID=A0A150FZR0_GONPE|nr:hypothetical protein GPECTOR_123g477 [Gonium pectorale]|eukprot:KXZ42705.1 hypothetical protein GPECTOR_123g477 [Gonium pectorale]